MPTLSLLFTLIACSDGFTDPSREFAEPVAGSDHPVRIHQPATLGVVDTPVRDINGTPVGVSCGTCHGPDAEGEIIASDEGNPEEVHSTVTLEHGELSCDSCHAEDRRYLHLADGTQLEMADAMQLCAQCHGPQYRDYQHASHGGMEGYWDLQRGPRDRNHCLDCHAQHSPAYEAVLPVFPPRDRGLTQQEAH